MGQRRGLARKRALRDERFRVVWLSLPLLATLPLVHVPTAHTLQAEKRHISMMARYPNSPPLLRSYGRWHDMAGNPQRALRLLVCALPVCCLSCAQGLHVEGGRRGGGGGGMRPHFASG
jgi:hypothetical protein